MKQSIILLTVFLLSITIKAQSTVTVSRNWVPFSQSIEVKADSVKKFKVIASVKIETNDEKAMAGVWARVDNKPDQGRGFFDNMGDRPIKSNKWKSYTVVGTIDSNSEKLSFGGICYNNGKSYFDKFELYIEDDNGEYQPVEINNSSFENKVVDNLIPEWNQGISKGEAYRVKEFTFNTSDDTIDGNYSILIEGSGINKKDRKYGSFNA